jgi:hypothetical protein
MRKDIKAAGDIGLNGGTEGPVFTLLIKNHQQLQ